MASVSERRGELVDLIYAALLGETSWRSFVERLVGSGDGWTALVSHDARLGEGMFGHYYGCDDALVHDYERHYAAINPWAPQCVAKAAGRAVTGNELVPRDRFVKTEFYNDFFRAHGTQDGAGVTIIREDDRAVMLSVMSADQDHEANEELSETLAYLYPHLRRAADFHRRSNDHENTLGLGTAIFDAIDVGVVVVGSGARPKSVSEAAAAMIPASSSLQVTPLGRLRFVKEEADEALGRMLAHGYEGPHTTSFSLADLKVTFVRMEKERLAWYFEGPTVVVLMEPFRQIGKAFDPEWFAEAFGLTRVELRALVGIVDGKSALEIAGAAGVSRETVRSQIKSLYLKTGVNSQAGLLRLVHSPLRERGAPNGADRNHPAG